jgi:flagellar motor protein MotB
MKQETDGFFWPSFVDLMTGLFIIGLILFILSYSSLSKKNNEIKVELEKKKRIEEIEKSLEKLPKDYFLYEPEYKRFTLKETIEFPRGDSIINPKYNDFLIKTGKCLQDTINNINSFNRKSGLDIRYLIIIEGMASKPYWVYNYELSYKRALGLFNFWRKHDITFDPKICEIMISGSGTEGVGRDSVEKKNQRFLIQIIPKVGANNSPLQIKSKVYIQDYAK